MNVWSKFTWFIFHFHYSFIFYQASIEELKLNRYDNSWNYLIVYLTFHSVVCVCVLADFLYSVRYRENSSEFVSWSRAANDRNAFYESRWTRCRWCSGVYVVQDSQLTTLRTCMLALHSLWFISSHICDILMDIHVILSSPVPRTFCLMFHKKNDGKLFTADALCVRDEHNRLEEQRRMLDQEMETVLQQRKAAEELAKVWILIIFMSHHMVYWLPLTSYEFVIH